MNRYLLAEAAQKQIEARMDDTPFETEDENESFVFGLCTAFNELNSVLAADVRENVHGEYVGEYDGFADGNPVYDIWSCSRCGVVFEDWDEKPTYNFCPNCGADMRKEVRDDAGQK